MSAPKALGWDKIACLFFQGLGRLAHQLQIRPDSAWIILVVFSFFLPWWVSSGVLTQESYLRSSGTSATEISCVASTTEVSYELPLEVGSFSRMVLLLSL